MTTITADLREKIERRAKRAWRRHRDGSAKSISRITGVTDKELYYRLPYTPDYYGNEKIKVVKHDDGTIEVDPKTKGLIKCDTDDELAKLKKHGDETHVYVRTDQSAEVGRAGLAGKLKLKDGKDLESKSAVTFHSRKKSIDSAKPGDRVFKVSVHADDITAHGPDYVSSKKFTVVEELDQEKDLGFTSKLLELLVVGDLEKLKKHIGKARLYLRRTKEKRQLKLNQPFTLKSEDLLTYREKAIKDCRSGDRVWEVEISYEQIKSQDYSGVKASECVLIKELDKGKDLGFTKGGLLDIRSDADIGKLRKHEGLVRAYKYTDKDAKSPVQRANAILYEEGKDYEVKDANTDDGADCAAGINLASVDYCKQYMKASDGHRAFAFEFHTDDLAAVPGGGKFRVFKCKCIEELDAKGFKPLKPKPTPPPPAPKPVQTKQLPSKGDPKTRSFWDKLFGR